MADARSRGSPRSALDILVAAIAGANGCVVVTHNEKDFGGRQVINPLKPA